MFNAQQTFANGIEDVIFEIGRAKKQSGIVLQGNDGSYAVDDRQGLYFRSTTGVNTLTDMSEVKSVVVYEQASGHCDDCPICGQTARYRITAHGAAQYCLSCMSNILYAQIAGDGETKGVLVRKHNSYKTSQGVKMTTLIFQATTF